MCFAEGCPRGNAGPSRLVFIPDPGRIDAGRAGLCPISRGLDNCGPAPHVLIIFQFASSMSDLKPTMTTTAGPAGDDENQNGLLTATRPKTARPSMYRVLLLNDDYTPMEFVVHILERFFHKNRDEATQIMLQVHQKGIGVCGVFTYEVAETKVTQVVDFARRHQHPLQCTMEKE